jgi:cell division protein FtsN
MKSTHGLFLDNKHINWIISGILFLLFAVFMGGYYGGKYKARQEQDGTVQHTISVPEPLQLVELSNEPVGYDQSYAHAFGHEDVPALVPDMVASAPEAQEKNDHTSYRAQLIGFGTQKAAQKFADRLSAQGIAVEIRTRHSKSSSGHNIAWYQVVTGPWTDRHALDTVVEQVKRQEKLHDVQIIPCA